jgi:hypothetical protein
MKFLIFVSLCILDVLTSYNDIFFEEKYTTSLSRTVFEPTLSSPINQIDIMHHQRRLRTQPGPRQTSTTEIVPYQSNLYAAGTFLDTESLLLQKKYNFNFIAVFEQHFILIQLDCQ